MGPYQGGKGIFKREMKKVKLTRGTKKKKFLQPAGEKRKKVRLVP